MIRDPEPPRCVTCDTRLKNTEGARCDACNEKENMMGYKVWGSDHPGRAEEIGTYKTDHAGLCAMASRIGDFTYMWMQAPNGIIIARFSEEGLK